MSSQTQTVLSENKLSNRFTPASPPLLCMKLAQWRHTDYVGHKWVGVSGLQCAKSFMTALLDSKAIVIHMDYHSHRSTH